MQRLRLSSFVFAPTLVLAVAATMLLAPATAEAAALRCADVSFAVSLTDGGPADQTVVGQLCARGNLKHKTVQVLLHGGTYDSTYWDFPLDPERYSYVRRATTAGFATLSLDRLGSGDSSHPDAGALSLHAGATAVHQVVQALRAGDVDVAPFHKTPAERVMLVGHSMGSFIASIEASTYADVDGVILSGYAHSVGPGQAAIQTLLYPAQFDPKFAGDGLSPLYFTTLPGTRGAGFYHLPGADPAVIARDEQLKQTVALGELLDIPNVFPATLGMTVPTLVAVGDHDSLYCEAPSCHATGALAGEAAFYPPEACVTVLDIPGAGHDLNLHKNAPVWFSLASLWSSLRVGADTRFAPPLQCD